MSLTQIQLAAALGLSQAAISQSVAKGMPVSSIEAARAWRETHLHPGRAKPAPRAPSLSVLLEEAEALLDVSRPTVYKDLELMESIGILSEVTGKPVNRDWVCREILSVIEADELPGNGGRSEAADPSAPEA